MKAIESDVVPGTPTNEIRMKANQAHKIANKKKLENFFAKKNTHIHKRTGLNEKNAKWNGRHQILLKMGFFQTVGSECLQTFP